MNLMHAYLMRQVYGNPQGLGEIGAVPLFPPPVNPPRTWAEFYAMWGLPPEMPAPSAQPPAAAPLTADQLDAIISNAGGGIVVSSPSPFLTTATMYSGRFKVTATGDGRFRIQRAGMGSEILLIGGGLVLLLAVVLKR